MASFGAHCPLGWSAYTFALWSQARFVWLYKLPSAIVKIPSAQLAALDDMVHSLLHGIAYVFKFRELPKVCRR